METRLDRIEKGIEALFLGIAELKESQKKTDEQLNRTDAQILELKEAQKKTDEQLNKTIKKLEKIGDNLGDLGIVQGEIAEELFYIDIQKINFARQQGGDRPFLGHPRPITQRNYFSECL